MKVEWKNKPFTTFKDIEVGECFSLQDGNDVYFYLKVSSIKVFYKKPITGEALIEENNAVNIKSGNLIYVSPGKRIGRLKATLIIET